MQSQPSTLALALAGAGALALAAPACSKSPEGAPIPSPAAPAGAARLGATFVDVTRASGVEFVHENGSFGKKWLPETMGSGVAILDFDGDGALDLFFANQRRWPGHDGDYAAPASRPATLRLYRNVGNGRFEDATDRAGLAVACCGMGVAAADVDGDGDTDLVVSCLGDTLLFLNEGGRFAERARERGLVAPRWRDRAGREHPSWGTAIVPFDYDRDGLLDLYVAAYAQWSEETDIFATLDGTTKAFTTPDLYPGDTGRLYRGVGGGRFEDVTEAAGLLRGEAKSLGAVACDLDEDGWPDLVVVNDTQPNFLFRNERGRFREIGVESGLAYDSDGRARAGMGVDVAREDGDGSWLLAIGNFSREPISLFEGGRDLRFRDAAERAGLAVPTYNPLTFGLLFLDADLDGRQDLVLCNGHIEPAIGALQPGITYRQTPQIFWNAGNGRFLDASAAAGAPFRAPLAGRGFAAGDLDGDGDSDLVLTQNGGPAVLLRCDLAAGPAPRALRLHLAGPKGRGIPPVGAVARARIGGRVLTRVVTSGSSYLSQGERVLELGLGEAPEVDELEVRWPTGERKVLSKLRPSARAIEIAP